MNDWRKKTSSYSIDKLVIKTLAEPSFLIDRVMQTTLQNAIDETAVTY